MYKIKWTQVSGTGNDEGSLVENTYLRDCPFSKTITGLQINTVYSIQVAAGNENGFSGFSDPVEICTSK